ncbi:MAG: cobalt-precorrin-5B (C(1))-methyltransferase CbiD [Proteobacteria bacterium]|nr:cobalt-precorrin-5B (C(1))-methyltransferase CbiD [Pseudomonadota bacterium]
MKLREGFTTGSAVTASIISALSYLYKKKVLSYVNIKAPAGILKIPVNYVCGNSNIAIASIIKDGGDDPDCTHGAEFIAIVSKNGKEIFFKGSYPLFLSNRFHFFSGIGIGVVTKEGLSIKKGEPAINPVPRMMIKENVESFLKENQIKEIPYIIVEVPKGIEIAKHTLNERLGIVGGISILGTTGVVKPVSMDAFTATIDISLKVAKKKKIRDIVLSFGRQSEMSAQRFLKLPEESFILMGDFFRYTLDRAKAMGFSITISGQPGKILKASMDSENTNVKYGEFSIDKTIKFLSNFCKKEELIKLSKAKTARHLAEIVEENKIKLWEKIAKYLAEKEKVSVLIFSYEGELLGRA